jgi:hypothetical protein
MSRNSFDYLKYQGNEYTYFLDKLGLGHRYQVEVYGFIHYK